MTKILYAALSRRDGKFGVYTELVYNSDPEPIYSGMKPIGDFRTFDTWDEADQVAKDAAAGMYNQPKGTHVNMR